VSIGLVIDTAALLAYSEANTRVGEVVAAVADRGETIVIPSTCLATAYERVPSPGENLLDVMATLPHALVAPLEWDHCAVVGGWARTLGLDTAHAAVEAATHGVVPIMTGQRVLLRQILPSDWPIIDI
jgi:hypothetical protein